jgi:hypothetical protein
MGARFPVFAATLLLAACSRGLPSSAPAAEDAGAPLGEATLATAAEAGSPPAASRRPVAPSLPPAPPPGVAEAKRTPLKRLDGEPLLRPHLAALREHFGAQASGPFVLQRVDLANGRTALMVAHPEATATATQAPADTSAPTPATAGDGDPIVLVVDRDALAWSKPRPAAGIVQPVTHLTIAPRPDGGVALFGYVVSLRLLAARMWADDGNPYAEIELGSFDACDTLSAAYAPGRGWVIACTSDAGTRAQRLREDGTTTWGREGTLLADATPVGHPALAFDTSSSFLLVERARAVGGDRLLALRFDEDARPLWPTPVTVDSFGAGPKGPERLRTTLERDGVVRVDWNEKAAEIDAQGVVKKVKP